MPERPCCPDCGEPLASSAEGLCPACLLRTGLADSGLDDGETVMRGPVEADGPGGIEAFDTTVSLGSTARLGLHPTRVDLGGRGGHRGSEELAPGEGAGRYEELEEIGRGGMGAVFQGRDPVLGRDLAFKVLLKVHGDKPDMVRRFVKEAQIGGQLQHPGVVPVYEMGVLPDDRPYFTMKLVGGRTLATMLAARKGPEAELARFLGIFLQACQAVAYVHSRGVIHRDLKPSNIMVGDFGEVQVMDWGLAKVLTRGDGPGGRSRAGRPGSRSIQALRSGSVAGSVLGTPAYMPPEQAAGEGDDVDERADVFGLGSILCEILTGQPAYTGRTGQEVFHKAARGETAEALARLEASGVEAELLALARDCLAVEPAGRPRDAGVVVERTTSYLAGVQDRLRDAELAKAESQARAEEEAKRRRVTIALAASLLCMAALVAGGWAWIASRRAEREAVTGREVNLALAQAATLRGESRATPGGDPALLELALSEARRAASLLASGEVDEFKPRVRGLVASLTRERDEARARIASAERDHRMVERLSAIRDDYGDDFDAFRMQAGYSAAFRDYGIDVDSLAEAESGARVAARPIATELVAGLETWAISRLFARRPGKLPDAGGAWRLINAANAADPDPWRKRLRESLGRDERQYFRDLVAEADVDRVPGEILVRLAFALRIQGDPLASANLLRTAQRRHPDDFLTNYDLAESLNELQPPRNDEALPYCMAAVSLRPRSRVGLQLLAVTLSALGRVDEAIATGRERVRIGPDDVHGRCWLSLFLRKAGRFDEAIAEAEEGLRIEPDNRLAHQVLGWAHLGRKDWDRAIASYRRAMQLEAPDSTYHLHTSRELADALRGKGLFGEAIASYRRAREFVIDGTPQAIEIDRQIADTELEAARVRRLPAEPPGVEGPGDDGGRIILARGLEERGAGLVRDEKYDEAISAYREAIALNPSPTSHDALANLARKSPASLGRVLAIPLDELRLRPDHSPAFMLLFHLTLEHPDAAIAAYRESLKARADDPIALTYLSFGLRARGRIAEAVASAREATELEPENRLAHQILGWALLGREDWDGAIASYRAAIRIKTDHVQTRINAYYELGIALKNRGLFEEAIDAYRHALNLAPANSTQAAEINRRIADLEGLAAPARRLPR